MGNEFREVYGDGILQNRERPGYWRSGKYYPSIRPHRDESLTLGTSDTPYLGTEIGDRGRLETVRVPGAERQRCDALNLLPEDEVFLEGEW